MFINFFCLCPLGLAINPNFNIANVACYIQLDSTRLGTANLSRIMQRERGRKDGAGFFACGQYLLKGYSLGRGVVLFWTTLHTVSAPLSPPSNINEC